MQPDPAAGTGQPLLHQLRVMVPGVVQEHVDQPLASLVDSALADRLDAVLELRELVEQLDAVELPKGFGRD